ncbi:MAG: YicC family protein [Proteobacteria bacterium]|nr:YicC family protein [Pseudomonadota bacterium]MDA1355177.1 YicC family protein [Pseudomonadota bacterium]
MTGFARAEGRDATVDWIWEAKSVNGRGLDLRCRLANGLEGLEPELRKAAMARFKRGNISINLRLTRQTGTPQVRVNRELLDEMIALAGEYRGAEGIERPGLDGLLALRGVIEPVEEIGDGGDCAARDKAIAASMTELLDELSLARAAEGASLSDIVGAQLATMESLSRRAGESAALRPEAAKARLMAQVAALLEAGAPLAEERLAQELAILAVKTDIREELDRLGTHIAAAKALVSEGGAIGRKLDFLAQELNREANTLCAKSNDAQLSDIGLDLKAVIDQFREQVQNIE